MKTMDRKIAQRRHRVTEQRAAGRLRLLIGIVVIAVLVAGGLWLVRSPLLQIDTITVHGAVQSNPAAVLDRLGISEGSPTISVDGAAVEEGLLTDPWIEAATVDVTWPGSLDIEVIEHVPVAVVQAESGFAQVTDTGVVVQMLQDGSGHATIVVPHPGTLRPGVTANGSGLLGALEFIAALPPELHPGTIVYVDQAEHLSATMGEYQLRLGRAVEMRSKAAAAVAVIQQGVEPGSVVDVTAPRRPAVANPQPEVEDEG
jgi:cell division protein FtsQ